MTAAPDHRPATGVDAVDVARMLIVDDHLMVRRGLREMLRGQSCVEVVGEAEHVAGALESIARLRPDVVLLDVKLGAENGLDVCPEILRRWPETKIVVLSAYEDETYLVAALRAGACGYFLKGVHPEPLVRAIEDVQRGKPAMDPAITGRLMFNTAGSAGWRGWPGATRGLSRRESEVLQEMARGLDNRQIAQKLYISEETVKSHVKAVLRKLGARDRTHGVVIALRGRVVR